MAIAPRASADAVGLVTCTATIPVTVQSGDTLLLFYEVADATPNITGPGGSWQLVDFQTTSSAKGYLWWKTAGPSDAGTNVSVTHDGVAGLKTCILIDAYSGAHATNPIHAYTKAAAGASSTTHTAPNVTTTIPDCLIVQAATAKSTTNASWVVSSPWVMRESVLNTGTGVSDGAVADGNTAVPAGTYGGAVFTMSVATSNVTKWAVALAPASTSQTARPVTAELGNWVVSPSGTGAGVLSDTDDATFIRSPGDPVAEVAQGQLGTLVDPGAGNPLTLHVRRRDNNAATVNWELELYQVIASVEVSRASWADTTVRPGPTWHELTLQTTAPEAAAIDYSEPVWYRVTYTATP